MAERKLVRIVGIQAGPRGLSKEDNIRAMIGLIRQASGDEAADLVVLPELGTPPYFCGTGEKRFLAWAEPIPGPTTEALATAPAIDYEAYLARFEREGGAS